VKVCN